jgi:hypothetical protein
MLLSFSEAAPKIGLQSKFPLPSGLARRESQALRLESGQLSGEPDVLPGRAQRKGTNAAKGTGAHRTKHTAFSLICLDMALGPREPLTLLEQRVIWVTRSRWTETRVSNRIGPEKSERQSKRKITANNVGSGRISRVFG